MVPGLEDCLLPAVENKKQQKKYKKPKTKKNKKHGYQEKPKIPTVETRSRLLICITHVVQSASRSFQVGLCEVYAPPSILLHSCPISSMDLLRASTPSLLDTSNILCENVRCSYPNIAKNNSWPFVTR